MDTIQGPLTNGPISRVDRRDGEEEERYVYHSNGLNGYHDNHEYHDNGTSGYHSSTTNDSSVSEDSFEHIQRINRIILINGDEGPSHGMPNGHHRRHAVANVRPV